MKSLLSILYFQSLYTNMDHAKEFHAMSEAIQFPGPLRDIIT